MNNLSSSLLEADRISAVKYALEEDIRTGDITALLVPSTATATATVITRETATLCGQAWVEEVYRQLDSEQSITLQWHAADGDTLSANDKIVTLSGPARLLLTGERTALNFLQTLSATATLCTQYATIVEGTGVQLLDTRKTIPGLRTAQKYAVTCGQCTNHRIGLYDAFLIKENHIMAAGSIAKAVEQARTIAADKTVEVEVESLQELEAALQAKADVIMLDNFTIEQIQQAVETAKGRAKLEISGNVDQTSLRQYAETGVDYISIGGLTKHVQAIDLSMRFDQER